MEKYQIPIWDEKTQELKYKESIVGKDVVDKINNILENNSNVQIQFTPTTVMEDLSVRWAVIEKYDGKLKLTHYITLTPRID